MSGEPGEQIEKTNREKGKSDDHGNQAQDAVPPTEVFFEPRLPAQLSPSPANAGSFESGGDDTKKSKLDGYKIATLILEILGVLGLAVYCYFTVREWRTFDSERKTMEAEFHMAQGNAAAAQSIAENQLKEMAQENALSERAWIYIEVGDNNLKRDETGPFIQGTLINQGKTPALITGEITATTLVTNFIPASIENPERIFSTINPGESGIIRFSIPDWSWNALTNNHPIYFFGKVFYRDIYQKEHWSECFYSVSDRGAVVERMEYHNACDALEDQQPKQ